MEFKIPILKNTLFDLSKFNFSFLGIKIYDIQSTEFEKFIKKLNPKFYGGNISHFNAVINEIHFEKDRKYAIVKNNYKENYSEEEIFSVFKLLKIIFPSGLDIAYIVNFQEENNFVQRTSMTIFENKYCPADLNKIVAECTHLNSNEQGQLLQLLQRYEDLFDGTLGTWQTDPVDLELKEPNVKPHHSKPCQFHTHRSKS